MGKHKHIFHRFMLVVGLLLFIGFTAHAVLAQNVTTGYQSDQTLQTGMIVRLKPGDSTKVEALPQVDTADMLGVVVSAGDAPVSLSTAGATSQVFVATYGQYDVLVSDQNGPISDGDYITVSSLSGVGMKADSTQQLVIGKALQSFDGRMNVQGTMSVKGSLGSKTVHLTRLPVAVTVAHNPIFEAQNKSGVPHFLAKAAQIVTDRPVSAFRIYASLIVLVLSVIVAGSILYAGVRSGMTSIGRNPLAKHSIIRSLISITLMSLIVFVIGIFAVYLLLRI